MGVVDVGVGEPSALAATLLDETTHSPSLRPMFSLLTKRPPGADSSNCTSRLTTMALRFGTNTLNAFWPLVQPMNTPSSARADHLF